MNKEILDVIPIDDIKEELKNLPDVNESQRDKEELKYELTTTHLGLEKPLTTFERYIVEKKALGWSEKQIAAELGIDENAVKRTLNKPIVKDFYREVMGEVKDSIKDEIVGIYLRIIRDKVKWVEEKHKGDFSKASRRDLTDILLGLDNIMKEEEKKKLGTTGNVFVNILQQVVKD